MVSMYFGGVKVTDGSNLPSGWRQLYHGTSYDSAQNIKKNGFNRSSNGLLGPGVYLSLDE